MKQITRQDLTLINNLRSRTYKGTTLTSNSTESERDHLVSIKRKLKDIANYFSSKYDLPYGPFETSVSSGNPMTRGNTFNNIWAGLFKGASNKQYAAQISFVMDKQNECLNVGFYFGRASGHKVSKEQKLVFERTLANLGISLSEAITNNDELRARYNLLFDFGFTAYVNEKEVLPSEWYNLIRINNKNSHIIAKIYPNDFGVIENSTIDSYVSEIIFLMTAINNTGTPSTYPVIKPLTPEQRAKQAERLAQIGLKGELFVFTTEKNKLQELGITQSNYPRHVAMESMHYGYDILSLDEKGEELYIEVKTTTRSQEDKNARMFFISNNEIDVFSNNKNKYKLYRVYNIENDATFEILDLNKVQKRADGFIVEY